MVTKQKRCGYLLSILAVIGLFSGSDGLYAAQPPAPFEPVPSPAQLGWHETELTFFCHFGMNTFTGEGTGSGREDPDTFNPTKLDCRQWIRLAAENDYKWITLIVKHHDGFCTWPTATTDHSVKSSKWRNGQGDVVKEVADACKEFGVKLGIYCSPWDLNYPSEASDYPKAYRQQITELLGGNYGEIAEMWFDGNRADRIGEWDSLITLVRTLQPNIVIKQGPIVYPIREDVQWVGSEKALAPITNWNPYTPRRPSGAEPIWFPVECDFPLLTSGWFWSPGRRPKTLDTLTRIYFTSVGRGSVFMVNISPDRDGLVPDDQVKVLTDLNYKLKRYFSTDFAKGKNATATNIRGNDQTFGPAMALDGDKNTYWATDDEVTTATLEVDLGSQTRFNMVRMMEMISLGQRVAEYRVEALQSNGNWRRVTDGTTIGYKKLDRFPNVTASKVRLVIVESKACPTIKEFGVHDTASTATSVKENSAKNSVTPSDIALFQKYTGSFAPGAEIACRLPKESYVTLKVYAITGKHIATLVNGYRRAGFSTHRWNGLDLWGNRIAGGVYLACFKAGNITKTIMVNIRK